MKRQPEIIVDEEGTTWALLGTHNGKAYYGNVDKLQESIEIPKIEIDLPPDHPIYPIAYHLITPPRDITITVTGI
ncbi:hypothetical protein SEA_VIBAKI_46 [Arthrobacter phage Vibaki]|uniref:Uncharacterized protein n=1 Tax=Arthrobacter phage Vibaki TaxID=2593333 RepID=A0A514TZ04_9CAUD|nr:hypothetical protein HYP95_gp46 [Arthrobacter phage Vibaki]QDK01926.1 hypothetical protein SEA_VIBAKI_46 [Arthrobacter phage Vibaki]